MAVAPNTNIIIPYSPFLNDQTGRPNTEWLQWLMNPQFITLSLGSALPVTSGGTGLTTIPTNGQLLIGNGTGYTLNPLTPGVGIGVTNGAGLITVANTGVLSNIAGTGISVSNPTGNVTIGNTGVLSWSGGSTGLTPATATTGVVTLAGTLDAGYGGTGLNTYVIGDLLYASGTTAFSRLADIATGNALISGGIATAPSWGKIGLTTHVSGTLPIANGGTNGTATATAGAVAYGTGTAYAFTAAGTLGQVLTSAGAGTPTWSAAATGTVTSVSVVSANGLAGTVATATTTPAITLSTTITGLLKGNGTAISAAASGTDYAPATSGTSILYGNGAGGFSNVTIGTGVAFAGGTLSATGSGGTVTSVTGTAPVVSSGGTTPAISMAAATTSVNGYLTSTDWTTFNGKQAALVSGTNIKTVNGTTLLGSGDLGTITYAYGGTGLTSYTAGDIIYASAANTVAKLAIGTSGQRLVVAAGLPSWATDTTTGTVTSVAASVPAFLSISGSPVTTSGTLAITLSGTALPVLNGGTGVTTSTGTGNTVLSAAPTLSGDVNLSTGNLVIGTSGKGIDFSITPSGSGTMTSELLADYEEGTWTPVIGGSGGTSGQTYDIQAGYYIKTGRSVQCTFRAILTAKGTITSNVQIQGLPFTSKNANGAQSVMQTGTRTTATGYYLVYGSLGINATAADLYGITSAQTNSVTVPLAAADINNSTQLVGCVFYYTDS